MLVLCNPSFMKTAMSKKRKFLCHPVQDTVASQQRVFVQRHTGKSLTYCVIQKMRSTFKDRHQWLGREFRGSLSLNMDKLFLKAIIYQLYH